MQDGTSDDAPRKHTDKGAGLAGPEGTSGLATDDLSDGEDPGNPAILGTTMVPRGLILSREEFGFGGGFDKAGVLKVGEEESLKGGLRNLAE